MPNKNYRKGYNFERNLVNKFRKMGCLAFRSAGSHSPIDVVAVCKNELYLIQCKSGELNHAQLSEAVQKMPQNLGDYIHVNLQIIHKKRGGNKVVYSKS